MFNKYFLSNVKSTRQLSALFVVVLVAAVGTYLLIGSHAASPYSSVTADNGALSGAAAEQTCAGASDGNCVAFGSKTDGGGGSGTVALAPIPTIGSSYAASTPAVSCASCWHPASSAPISWNWVISNAPAIPTANSAADTQVYDVDGFGFDYNSSNVDTDAGTSTYYHPSVAATVSSLKAAGVKDIICYIDVGTYENWRPDAAALKAITPSVLGSGNGWPGEQWLNIADVSALEPIMADRMNMCKQEGFTAIEPDNIDGYENSTGFPLTQAEQSTYDAWIAQEAHTLGMSIGQKNNDDNGEPAILEPYFDWMLDEQCNQYNDPCTELSPYYSNDKAVFNAEYTKAGNSGGNGGYAVPTSGPPSFCSNDDSLHINGVLYDMNLDGATFAPCLAYNATSW